MENSSDTFKTNVAHALADVELQKALQNVKRGFVVKREAAKAKLPEFDKLRDEARAVKDHTLSHLDLYLEAYERKVTESGGVVHFAETAADARAIVLELCRELGAKLVTKGKSMISEEIGLNAHLEASGIEVVETDLGEYIVQIRGETPSHIIAPVIHLNKEDIAQDFRRVHKQFATARKLNQVQDLVAEARAVLREKFLKADIGITGANLLIAETGSSVIVTNEGNGDLTSTLPRAHIVVASIEKVVPTLEDADTILRLLARSGTGQEITTYTTFVTGPRRDSDPDGPVAYHVVLLDNGRSEMLGGVFADMLRCIRCGACQNVCPVYRQVGGTAYGWVYGGPIGAVLTPLLHPQDGLDELGQASSLCAACDDVCPVGIPLHELLLGLRRDRAATSAGRLERLAFRALSAAWSRPWLYRLTTRAARRVNIRGQAPFMHVPVLRRWARTRDLRGGR
ncbi:MAG TPA: iron-sulfur cluster-binding protein [Rhizobiales bacterium]|nr:iron-sulfur cluster-binding protein [Hyphomicrobiales bacterium]